jgi:anthranilate phosphoribosyltransferase
MPGDMTQLKTLLARVADGHRLSEAEATEAFEIIMSGNATPAQMGAFLMALRVRGETVDEIVAAARTMRGKALKILAPDDAVEAVGTGGDASGSFNISTATSFVVAGCGLKVAKHGNRAFSSKSGAADVLTALGVNIDCDTRLIEYAISKAGVGFMMAPRHHSATRHVAGVRVEVGTRTIFNLLGPLSNPAGVKRQLVGVFARKWVAPLAETLGRLGSRRAWVVHGSTRSRPPARPTSPNSTASRCANSTSRPRMRAWRARPPPTSRAARRRRMRRRCAPFSTAQRARCATSCL